MKKVGLLVLFVVMLFVFSGCGNKKFIGYWCRYDETSIVTVMLKNDVTEAQSQAIKDKLTEYGDATNFVYYSKEDYAKLIGENAESLDIYATYVVSYPTNNYIGTLVTELNAMDGVEEALQTSARNNLLLYNLKKDGSYTFTDSDEKNEDDYVKGKYKLKNGVITFTDKDKKTTLLYIKDGHLCVDADCTKIFAKSDENCKAVS